MGRARKGRALAVLLAVALPAALVTGCGQPDSPATPLLRRADRRLGEAIEGIRGLEKFQVEIDALLSGDRPPGTAAKLKQVLERARSGAQGALDELDGASVEIGKAAAARVGPAMREYLRMKSGAVDEQRRSLRATVRAMDLRLQTADAIVVGSPLDQALLEKIAEISRLEEEAGAAASSSAELHRKANDYYEKKKLGR